MKAYIVKQWEEICSVDQSSELYRIFVRVLQALLVIAGVIQVVMFVPMMMNLDYGVMGPAYLVVPLVLTIGQIFLLAYAQRCIEAGKFRGTMIGLMVSLFCLPSWFLPLGVFGLYCFLNPEYQRKHLANAPKPFVDFLQLLSIDFTQAKPAEEVAAGPSV